MKSLLFSFHGRINRLPFWIVTLILTGWGLTLQQLFGPYAPDRPLAIGPGLVTIASFVIALWIGLAVQIKRWHDLDKSGWWALLTLIPVIGPIWILIECGFLPGTSGDNRYGGEPKTASA